MKKPIALVYYSDVLCIWAHISQARVDEVAQKFTDNVSIEYRFCSVFGDTKHKIGEGWAARGGYEGFGKHVEDSVTEFEHINVHPQIWRQTRPTSSTPAHLMLKAVQHLCPEKCKTVLEETRLAFFEHCRDISQWSVLADVLAGADLSVSDVKDVIDSGVAHAELEADRRHQQSLLVQGSPTYILNEGRQKLYGNVGYRVIEANITELLRSPVAGAASWC